MDPRNLERARAFLGLHRIAFVGLSRNEQDFSRYLFRELVKRGIDVVPVNPALGDVEGRPCFGRLQDVTPPVEGAFVMTPPQRSEDVIADCAAAGVKRVWFHRGGGRGSGSEPALALCATHGIEPVRDLCPFMALPGAGLGHRLHGWFRTRLG